MAIKLLFFGKLADITGMSEMFVESFDTTSALISFVENQFPEMKNNKYSLALNQKMIKGNYKLNNNDTVAFMPPFAGG